MPAQANSQETATIVGDSSGGPITPEVAKAVCVAVVSCTTSDHADNKCAERNLSLLLLRA